MQIECQKERYKIFNVVGQREMYAIQETSSERSLALNSEVDILVDISIFDFHKNQRLR